MGKLTAGFGAVPKAFGLLLRHARLRRLAVVPALISTVLLLVLVVLSVRYGGALLDRLWPAPDQLEGWRAWLASGAHWLAAVLVTGLLLVLSDLTRRSPKRIMERLPGMLMETPAPIT